ncbi:uncharacterized protein PV09_08083 [Verruconis gallopava]|uniref:ABM domain-containing protein n=1 Tax=Verruconis gallopava TaxID=253628 RepID=A0A0D1YHN6_9PEZI|nr:uncharacterized protein PV09_08083 [Verruconis gallopava]KIW00372.1 hypothetical protein PV09_08083 [Verruconis gallopava]
MVSTEFATVRLKPGTDVKSEGKGKEIVDLVCETVSRQEGCLFVASGVTVEDPEVWEMVVEWRDIADHKRFQTNEAYGPFMEKARTVVSEEPGSLVINHADLTTPISDVTSAPVVEVLLFYAAPDAGRDDELVAAVRELVDAGLKNGAAVTNVAAGWVVEPLEWPEKFEGKAKAYRVVIGWESVEKHMEYRETDSFKQTIPAVRACVLATDMHHTVFNKYEKP